MGAAESFFVAGGTLAADAESYVERAADAALLSSLIARKFCYVLNSRQMGKSSMCIRTMKKLHDAGVRSAMVDLTKIGGRNVTAEQWYAGIAAEIGRSLRLREAVMAYWTVNTHLSGVQRLFGALREVALEKTKEPLVVFFDEIDATRSLSFSADEFFAAIRECYNRRVQDLVYKRLTFCLLGVAVPSDLINSPTSTPFNIGERIYLRDFTLEEVQPLAEGFSHRTPNTERRTPLLERAFHWTNGHPYLTQSLCQAIASDPAITTPQHVDALVARDLFEPKARETNINLADVANRALHAGDLETDPEKFRADLLSAYEKAWKCKPLADDESNRVAALLKLSGLMRSEGNRLYVRNRIYERVFDKAWIHENMPGQELRRQKRAFRIGAIRAGGIAAVVIGIISWFAFANAQLRDDARRERDEAALQRDQREYEAYVAIVNLMKSAYDSGDLSHLQRLLAATRESPHRGLEWNYWNASLHEADYEEPSFPKGPGGVSISSDGRQIAITDRDSQSGEIRTYPELKLIAKVPRVPGGSALRWIGSRFAVLDLSNREQLSVRDALTGHQIYQVSVPRLMEGTADGSFWRAEPSTGGNVIALHWIRKRDSLVHDLIFLESKSGRQIGKYRSNKRIYGSIPSDYHNRFVAIEVEDNPDPDHYFDGRSVVVADFSSGKRLDERPISGEWISTFGISPEGGIWICCSVKGEMFARDVDEHRDLWTKEMAVDGELNFSRDGSRFVIQPNLTARLIESRTGRILTEAKGSWAAAISPDGRSFAVVRSGTRVHSDSGSKGPSFQVRSNWLFLHGFNSKGNLVGFSAGLAREFHPMTLEQVGRVPGKNSIWIRPSSDANYLIRRSDQGGSEAIELASRRIVTRIPDSGTGDYNSDLTVNSKKFASVNVDHGSVLCYDLSGKFLWRYDSNESPVTVVRWSRSGTMIGAGKDDGSIALLDGNTGEVVKELRGTNGPIMMIAFSHDDRRIAAACNEPNAYIFDTESGKRTICQGHSNGQAWVEFSLDGSRVLTSSWDDTARLWDTVTGRQMLVISSPNERLQNAVLSPDGKRFYIAWLDGRLTIRPLAAPDERSAEWKGHSYGRFNSLAGNRRPLAVVGNSGSQ